MPDYSLINTRGLTKPVTVLIEKISSAVGIVYEPTRIRRVAHAEANADRIMAQSDIEIDEIRRRAANRFIEEETRKQLNMESIVEKAIQNVEPDAPTEEVEDDWITNFFEKCRSVSDDEMQGLWSRILSGEANSPGSFSRKTVNLVADLDKESADLFHSLCSFGWDFGGGISPLILDFREQIYIKHGLTLFSFGQLDSIGLIQIDATSGFVLEGRPKEVTIAYHAKPVILTFPKEEGNSLNMGKVILTLSGSQLSSIVNPSPIDGFFEFIYDRWAGESLVPPRKDET